MGRTRSEDLKPSEWIELQMEDIISQKIEMKDPCFGDGTVITDKMLIEIRQQAIIDFLDLKYTTGGS